MGFNMNRTMESETFYLMAHTGNHPFQSDLLGAGWNFVPFHPENHNLIFKFKNIYIAPTSRSAVIQTLYKC